MSLTEQQTTLPTGTWQLDPVHSKAAFAIKHAGLSTFRGHFGELSAELTDASGTPTLSGSVKVESVEVPVDQLKGHLLGPDFFDAERFPEISFKAEGLRQDGEQLKVEGELTMRGVTKAVESVGTIAGPAQYFDGADRIALELSTVVDRTDYGITWNAPIPSGGNALADEVTITVELQLVRSTEA
jgi:polyisoprenoid-binding protein YceI